MVHVSIRRTTAGAAAILLACLVCVYAGSAAAKDAIPTETVTEETQTATEETGETGAVTVVHSGDLMEEDYHPKTWWKADVDEYDDLSLVSYETVKLRDTNDAEGAELIAQGKDDTIVSRVPASSAVPETADGTFAFTTYGYGHGVGMSQNGANFYAKYAGWSYQDILFHYYPGTTLMNTGTAESEIVTVQGIPGNVLQTISEVVYNEVGSTFHVECMKAQAVAAYTYIKYYNGDGHDLIRKPNPPQNVIDACASVLGEALYYRNSYCVTMFCASSGGITANSADVFYADIPYLRSVSSEYDEAYDPHWGEVTTYSIEEVRRRLQAAYGIRLSSDPRQWIQLVEGNGGYIREVIVDGKITVKGNAFRSVMGLKSPKFTYICNINGTEAETETATETDPVSAELSTPSTLPVDTTPEPTEKAEAPTAAATQAVTTEPETVNVTEPEEIIEQTEPVTEIPEESTEEMTAPPLDKVIFALE